MLSPSKRREMDFTELMTSNYKVETINDEMQEFYKPNDRSLSKRSVEDPLNGEAAALVMRDRQTYELKVKGTLECGRDTDNSKQTVR